MRTRLSTLLVFGACAVAVGCGSADSGAGAKRSSTTQPSASTSKSSSAPLTKAAYVKKVNAVCRAASAKSPAFPGTKSGSGYATTAALVVPYLEKVHRINVQTLAQLERLRPESAGQAAVDRLVSAERARVRDLDAALKAAQKKDAKAFTAAFQRDQKKDAPRYYAAAVQLGLSACASG